MVHVSLPALRTLEATFQAKNNLKSAPAITALAQVLHRSHNARTTNRHLCGSGERNGAQRRAKVSFDKAMMQVLLAKGTSRDKAMPNSVKMKSIALVVIGLCLSEGISK